MSLVDSRPRLNRRAFTLLEVLLALAIFVGALATIGELTRMGYLSARRAQASAQAQIHCESKLAEITSGMMLPAAVIATPLVEDPHWLYSIVVEPTSDAELLKVSVTVAEDLPPARGPVQLTLVRWMIDPQLATNDAAVSGTALSTGGGATQ